MQTRVEDICVAAPEVLEEMKARLKVKVQLFDAVQTQSILRWAAGMSADSDGFLQSAMARALLIVADPDSSDADKVGAWTYLVAALPRGAKAMRQDGEEGKSSSDPTVMETVVSYADTAVKLDKGVDAVQEAVAEGGPWVGEVVTDIVTNVSSGHWWGMF